MGHVLVGHVSDTCQTYVGHVLVGHVLKCDTASPHQTHPGHVLARANRKCTPGQVTMNRRGIAQSMKGKREKTSS